MQRRSPVEVEVKQREERGEDGDRRQAVQARRQGPLLPVEVVVYEPVTFWCREVPNHSPDHVAHPVRLCEDQMPQLVFVGDEHLVNQLRMQAGQRTCRGRYQGNVHSRGGGGR